MSAGMTDGGGFFFLPVIMYSLKVHAVGWTHEMQISELFFRHARINPLQHVRHLSENSLAVTGFVFKKKSFPLRRKPESMKLIEKTGFSLEREMIEKGFFRPFLMHQ